MSSINLETNPTQTTQRFHSDSIPSKDVSQQNARITSFVLESLQLVLMMAALVSYLVVQSGMLAPAHSLGMTYFGLSASVVALVILPITLAVNACWLKRLLHHTQI
jgi:hypothetical protein